MKKYWFRPKEYGYGLVPISAEGWIATLIIITIGILLAYVNNFFNPSKLNFLYALLFISEIFLIGYAFVKIFEKKSSGKLKWRWGKRFP